MIATSNQLSLLKEEIRNRSDDISRLISLLDDKQRSILNYDQNIVPCISATVMLGLYNILEYLLCECINYICDEIKSNNVTYFFIQPGIREILYKQATKCKREEVEKLFHYASCRFIPDRSLAISGNADFKQLNFILKSFCIMNKSANLPGNRSQINLDTLKDIRNDISHGNKSLSSVIYTYSDIEHFFEYMQELFLFIMDGLELCINEKRYQINPSTP